MGLLPFSKRSAPDAFPFSKQAQDPVRRTAESILKIINFLLFRVQQKDKTKFLQRIRGKIMRIPSGQVSLKKLPQTAAIGQAISLTKNILSGLNPFFVKRVVDELANMMLSQAPEQHRPKPAPMPYRRSSATPIPFSKRAMDVVIEPLDPAVQQAVSRIRMRDPGLLARVHKIVVHPGGGAELGHVESGPQKDPQEIHLFKGRIEEMVRQQTAGSKPTPADFTQALEQAIVEVIGHEAGHIGPERPIAPGAVPFLGEPEAETKAKETIRKIYPESIAHAALELDAIRRRFLPDAPMDEPDLAFVAKIAVGNKEGALREGLRILRRGSVPATLALDAAHEHNMAVVRQRDIARCLGHIVLEIGQLPSIPEFGLGVARWQEMNLLEPTGKLDGPTMALLRSRIKPYHEFPRNFAKVDPSLYRGRQPDDIGQLAAMRDKLGVRRIVTLNDDMPEIADWCKQLGLRHIHAPLSDGGPQDPGWEILTSDLVKFLQEVPAFVHCRHGADRTGGVIARYRTESGWPCDLAYAEAKAFGFKDRFPDMVDRFTEACRHDSHSHRHPPIDTAAMRRILAEQAARQPMEQNLLEPTPSDLHYTTDSGTYDSGVDTILSPFSIRSIPTGYPGGGR